MKPSKAQELAEQAIYDYTCSSKWRQVKYMNWTTSGVQDVIAKALVKNFSTYSAVNSFCNCEIPCIEERTPKCSGCGLYVSDIS